MVLASVTLGCALDDVAALMVLHDEAMKRKRGRPPGSLEVLKRAALILTVTAWETFIEDAIEEAFEDRLAAANGRQALAHTRSVFNSDAGWKDTFLREDLKNDLANIHTPNPKNIRKISMRFLGFDLTKHWTWTGTSSAAACLQLKQLIQRRGELVHRAKPFLARSGGARRDEVARAHRLVERLGVCTVEALGIEKYLIKTDS